MIKQKNFRLLKLLVGYGCVLFCWKCEVYAEKCENSTLAKGWSKYFPYLLKNPTKGIAKHLPATWEEAKNHCRSKGKTLFNPANKSEIIEIKNSLLLEYTLNILNPFSKEIVTMWTDTKVDSTEYPFLHGKEWLNKLINDTFKKKKKEKEENIQKRKIVGNDYIVAIQIEKFRSFPVYLLLVSPNETLTYFCTCISSSNETNTSVDQPTVSPLPPSITSTNSSTPSETTESFNDTAELSSTKTSDNSTATYTLATNYTETESNATAQKLTTSSNPISTPKTTGTSNNLPLISPKVDGSSFKPSTVSVSTAQSVSIKETVTTVATNNDTSSWKTIRPTANLHVTTTSTVDYCEGKTTQHENGIKIEWPDTNFGSFADPPCPKPTFGSTYWKCSGSLRGFKGRPYVNCRFVNCSEHLEIPDYSREYMAYKVERLAACEDNDDDMKGPHDIMKQIRNQSFGFRVSVESFNNSKKIDRKQMKQDMSTVFGMFDRLMDKDAKIWSRLGNKKSCQIASMEMIKETEETAWIMGCLQMDGAIRKDNIAVEVFDLDEAAGTDLNVWLSTENVGKVQLPRYLKMDSQRVCRKPVQQGIVSAYKNIESFLNPNDSDSNITSGIIGVSLDTYNTTFNLPNNEKVLIILYHEPTPQNATPICVFLNWNKNGKYGIWDDAGCTRNKNKSGTNYTVCECDHLTNFAILMDFVGTDDDIFSKEDNTRLSYLSAVCCGLSSISLLLIIIIYLTVKSLRSKRSTITCNVAICLLGMNILAQTGLTRVATTVCKVVSGLLQYFVLSAFSWMLLEGALLYRMVILVFETTKIRLRVLYLAAYGIPLVIVSLSSAVNSKTMIRDKYCWPSKENGHIYSVIGPIMLVISVNLIIFCMTLNAASKIDKMNSTNASMEEKKKVLKKRLKGMLSLMCLLGFTWTFGFFYVPDTPIQAYLFVSFNGLQGVFLFVTQLILNDHARHKLFVICKENMARFTSVTSSWNMTPNAKFKNNSEEKKEQKGNKELSYIYPPVADLKNCNKKDPVILKATSHIELCKIRLRIIEPGNYPQKSHPFQVNSEIEMKSGDDYMLNCVTKT